jgi:hypothetical protein
VIRLSKSKVQAYDQCPKRLWLELNPPAGVHLVNDDAQDLILARGTKFGEAVRACFDEGVLINGRVPSDAVLETAEALQQFKSGKPRVPIFGAAFERDGVVVYVDILEPLPDQGWALIELKSSIYQEGDRPKAHHVRDAATQALVVRKCGLNVERVELGYPDGRFVLPPSQSIEGILSRIDVTARAQSLSTEIENSIAQALKVAEREAPPERTVGAHCSKPYGCAFLPYCAGAYRRDADSLQVPVWHLTAQPNAKIVADLMQEGFRDLAVVPEERLSKPIHRRIRRVAQTGRFYADERLLTHLKMQPYPRYFLDYETINLPFPLWVGTRPGERVTFQFSLHKWISEEGPLEHVEFIGDLLDDPRALLAQTLAEAIEQDGRVYAWNGASTEGPITRELADYAPSQRVKLEWIAQSCRDNDPVKWFREWFYHPAMCGSWSLKSIAKAVLPISPYSALEVGNGVDAMREYERFLKMSPGPERDSLRGQLLEYCGTDTEVVIDVWRAVERLAPSEHEGSLVGASVNL